MKAQKMTIENNAILIANSHHGQYIPQLIAQGEIINPLWDWSKVSEDDKKALLDGPDNEWYWDAWSNALDNITVNFEGVQYFLCHNDDLWLIPDDCADQIEHWLI